MGRRGGGGLCRLATRVRFKDLERSQVCHELQAWDWASVVDCKIILLKERGGGGLNIDEGE